MKFNQTAKYYGFWMAYQPNIHVLCYLIGQIVYKLAQGFLYYRFEEQDILSLNGNAIPVGIAVDSPEQRRTPNPFGEAGQGPGTNSPTSRIENCLGFRTKLQAAGTRQIKNNKTYSSLRSTKVNIVAKATVSPISSYTSTCHFTTP
jgi:hypothetical protein